MNFKKVFSFFSKSKKLVSLDLDKRLIRHTSKKILPKWGQFKYIWQFLSQTEKIIVKITSAIFIISLGGIIFTLLINNRILVPTIGGEYTEALIGQPKLINPIFSSTNDVDDDISYLIYSGLFQYNYEGKLLPDLASKYTISTDQKTYTINLRKDVRWSDGKNFTADDIIFTFNLIQNPLVGSPLSTSFQGVTITKINDYTITFSIKEPYSPFLGSLTIGILPAHIWQNISPANIKLAKNNLQPIGTGPWKFNKLVKDTTGNLQSYELIPNDQYYRQLPYLQKIIFKFYPDYVQSVQSLKSQEVDGLSFVPENLKNKISKKNFNFINFKLPQYTAIFFNLNKTKLQDDDLRLALKYATNKTAIKKTLNNNVDLTNSPFLQTYLNNSSTNYYNQVSSTKLLEKTWNKIEPEKYFNLEYKRLLNLKSDDIEKIKNDASSTPKVVSSSIKTIENNIKNQLRQKMDSKQSFYLADKNNNFLELSITTFNTDEYRKVANSIAEMWKRVGIKTNVILVDRLQIQNIIKKRDYEILLYSELIGADPDPYPFWHSSQAKYPGLNLSGFNNSDGDKLLVLARSTNDSKKRKKDYLKFKEILDKENPAIFLYTPTHTFIVNKQIKGVNLSQAESAPNRFASLNNWYLKTKSKIQWR